MSVPFSFLVIFAFQFKVLYFVLHLCSDLTGVWVSCTVNQRGKEEAAVFVICYGAALIVKNFDMLDSIQCFKTLLLIKWHWS